MGPPWIDAAQLWGRVLLFGSRARRDGRPDSGLDLLVVGEADARRLAGCRWHAGTQALRQVKELHLGSLRGTLDPATFAAEGIGFLAQQTLEKLLKALCWCFTARKRPAAIRCNGCSRSLARHVAEPTPLPAERRLLVQLEAFLA
jgi:hypothetical protein